MNLPIEAIEDTVVGYLPQMGRRRLSVYWVIIVFLAACAASLFFIHVYISISCSGMIRPSTERTDLRASVSGMIDSVYCKEGDFIGRQGVIACLRDSVTAQKEALNLTEISQYQQLIHDLEWLTSSNMKEGDIGSRLATSLYKGQALRFLNHDREQLVSLKKAAKEVEMNRSLANDRVISPKEFYDLRGQLEKTSFAYRAFRQEQISAWQQDLLKYRSAFNQCRLQQQELSAAAEAAALRAPIAGIVQGIATSYPGSHVQANDIICSISPGGSVVGECYVFSRDIGLIHRGQAARFRIDAFDFNHFGVITGYVSSVDNDYTMIGNNPMFKIRCHFDDSRLQGRKGFCGELKKGLTFQARLIVASRTLWQLLFDRIDDWIP